MGRATAFLTGTLLGVGAAYFFDSRMGNQRRGMVRDRIRRLSRETMGGVDAGVRDLKNKTKGLVHDVGSFVEQGSYRPHGNRRGGETGVAGGWSPGTRLIAAAGGTALMANCLARRTPGAMLLGTLGFGLFLRAMPHADGEYTLEKTMEIDAPVPLVYEYFANPENYERTSDAVTNVKVLGDGRFAKDIAIAGVPIYFEERFVRMEKDKLLESHSESGSSLQFCKQLQFEQIGERRTRLRMRFNYVSPGGIVGHNMAILLGVNAKTVLNDLLMRAKYFLETGRVPHDAMAKRKAQAKSSAASSGNGSHRAAAPSEMHGAGAPMEDVRRLGVTGFEQSTPWPISEVVVSSDVPSEHFPIALD